MESASTLETRLDMPTQIPFPNNMESVVKKEDRRWLANIWQYFFTAAYYLGVMPFKIQICKPPGKVEGCKKSIHGFQRVFCAFLNLLLAIDMLSSFRGVLEKVGDKRPTSYFGFIAAVTNIIYKVVFMKRNWRNSAEITAVVNYILWTDQLPVRRLKIGSTKGLLLIFSIFAFYIFGVLFAGHGVVGPLSEITLFSWITQHAARARRIFFLPSRQLENWDDLTIWDYILCGITIISRYSRISLSVISDVYILLCSVTIWVPASAFAWHLKSVLQIVSLVVQYGEENWPDDQLEMVPIAPQSQQAEQYPEARLDREGSQTVEEGNPSVLNAGVEQTLEENREDVPLSEGSQLSPGTPDLDQQCIQSTTNKFEKLEELADVVNLALGSLAFWMLFDGLVSYSTSLNEAYVTENNLRRLTEVFWYILLGNILYNASDIIRKVDQTKKWLRKGAVQLKIPTNVLVNLLDTIKDQIIGIRPNDLYTITFGISSAFLTLVTTFFLICVQAGT